MIGGFCMKKDPMRFSKPQECSICRRIFVTPNALLAHFEAFHSNRLFSSFSSSVPAAASPTTVRHHPYRNPNPVLSTRNRFDLNFYRTGYLDEQGRFQKRDPAVAPPTNKTNILFGQNPNQRPTLMDLFPATLSEDDHTLPLLRQMEQRRSEVPVTRNDTAKWSSIDLKLRL
ncbi:unnamed protein product [Microthlaspi erraticum]|uniref:C2H2-type domain-containing protein n=1 Tax=Microthlaspi erraticum TaxID=1685480 RepID=A0A6D2HQG0_9BRAS|nr:unnamed protein product [Microthlaspi erraticum]